MSTKRFVWLSLPAAVALLCATCAPVEQRSIDTPTATKKEAPPEQLLHNPKQAEDPTRLRVESAIEYVRSRELTTNTGFWTVFHGILGLGPNMIIRDPKTGQKYVALDYIWSGHRLPGQIFTPSEFGVDVESTGDAIGQGHQDQFASEMVQWSTPADRKIIVGKKEYKFLDFANHSRMRASTKTKQELSWAVIMVSQFYGTDHEWTNMDGEDLTLQDLVRYELDASVEEAACGGTHRLFGLTWAYHTHLLRGGKNEGIWKEVEAKTAKYRDKAKQLRNADGALSTSFFKGRGDDPNKTLRMNTTGHTFEWLAFALSDEELKKPWMQEAANALALMILNMQDAPIDGGSLYHAVHGLQIYHARVYGKDAEGKSFTPVELAIPQPPKK